MSSIWQWFFGSPSRSRCVVILKDDWFTIQFWEGDRQICHADLKNKPARIELLCQALANGQDFEFYDEEPINGCRQFSLVGQDIKIGLENYAGSKSTQGCIGFALDRTTLGPLLLAELRKH